MPMLRITDFTWLLQKTESSYFLQRSHYFLYTICQLARGKAIYNKRDSAMGSCLIAVWTRVVVLTIK